MDELSNLFGDAEQLWKYIKTYASKSGREACRIVLELYYVVRSPHTPALDKTIIIAALGYQLLPNDVISRERYDLLGLLDNGAVLALAYNRVKTRVTPQIEAQVDAILNQWFGSERPQRCDNNNDSSGNCQGSQTATRPVVLEGPLTSHNPQIPLVGYDDEDVVID